MKFNAEKVVYNESNIFFKAMLNRIYGQLEKQKGKANDTVFY